MIRITNDVTLEKVKHIYASGNGLLDFAVEGESEDYVWDGVEDAQWSVTGVSRIENAEMEDRFYIYPDGDFFVCEIEATDEELNTGEVVCYST